MQLCKELEDFKQGKLISEDDFYKHGMKVADPIFFGLQVSTYSFLPMEITVIW